MGHVRYYGFRGLFNLVLVLLVLPLLLVLLLGISSATGIDFPSGLSLTHFAHILDSPGLRASLGISLIIASATALLATILGTLAAVGLARMRLPGRILLVSLVVAPMVIPAAVWALGLRFVLEPLGLLGSFTGLILAHTVLTAPLVFVAVSLSLRSLPTRLLYAGLSLGADAVDVFRTITVPLMMPGIVAGVMIAFVVSLGDVAVSLMLGGNALQTLPVSMFKDARLNVDAAQAAIGSVLIVAAALAAAGVTAMRRWHDRLWGTE
ncbi:MAG: ABC transporter permease subunit [Gammaproteobacteria bacterium]|nr:ABC transporter permease subunit [Gammaproteobacteria bacterium]